MSVSRNQAAFQNAVVKGRDTIAERVELWKIVDSGTVRSWLARVHDHVLRDILLPTIGLSPADPRRVGKASVGLVLSHASDLHHYVGMGLEPPQSEWDRVIGAVRRASLIHGVDSPNVVAARESGSPARVLALVCCLDSVDFDPAKLAGLFETAAEVVCRSPNGPGSPWPRASRAYRSMLHRLDLVSPVRLGRTLVPA